jgi:hypothetical protein
MKASIPKMNISESNEGDEEIDKEKATAAVVRSS